MASNRRKHRRPGGNRSTRDPGTGRRRRGPIISAVTAVPVGIGLAAILLLGSAPHGDGTSRTGKAAPPELPDSSAPPDDFFAAPQDDPPEPAPPGTGQRDATASGRDGILPPSSPPTGNSGGSGGTEEPDTAATAAGAAAETVVALANEERADAGCAPLRIDPDLTEAAEKHSADMAAQGYMSHESPDGATPADRAARAGYNDLTSENIAAGYGSAEAVMEGWMESEGHRANILDCGNKAVGVGEHRNRWTQKFGAQ